MIYLLRSIENKPLGGSQRGSAGVSQQAPKMFPRLPRAPRSPPDPQAPSPTTLLDIFPPADHALAALTPADPR